jgi:hypothetical protein
MILFKTEEFPTHVGGRFTIRYDWNPLSIGFAYRDDKMLQESFFG